MNDQARDDRAAAYAVPAEWSAPLFGATSFFSLLAIFGVFHIVQLTSFPLSIDDEIGALGGNTLRWLQEGRFTIYLFETYVLPQPVLPFLPSALFGVFLTVAYLTLLKSFGFRAITRAHLATFALFSAFPTWYFLLEFQPNTPAEGFGVLAGCTATLLLARAIGPAGDPASSFLAKLPWLAAASMLGAISIGAYQSNAMLLAVLGIALITWHVWNDPHPDLASALRSLAALALTLVVTLLAYAVLFLLFQRVFKVTTNYIDTLLKPELFFQQPAHALSKSYQEMTKVYLGSKRIYGIHAFGFGFLLLAGLAALMTGPAAERRVKAMLIGLAVLLLIIPFTLNPISAADGIMAYRTLVSVPAVVWFFAFLALSARHRWLVGLAGVAVIFAMFEMLYVGNLLQASKGLVRQHDLVTAAAVYDRIAAANPNFDRTKPYKVAFVGFWRFPSAYPKPLTSTAGASFFEWDNGNPSRMALYMKLLGYGNLVPIDKDDQRPLLPVAAAMPAWPAEGSVRVDGDVTLVKFSDPFAAPARDRTDLHSDAPVISLDRGGADRSTN